MSDWQILVVEDTDDDLNMVSKILHHHHINIVTARNGFDCLRKLEDVQPTAIIMDLAMPDMNGWETLIEIRSNSLTAHIPVIAVTAYGSDRVQLDAIAAGFNGYIGKPLKPGTLVQQIGEILAAL